MVENTELKISVVIPMYNASQSIVKALELLLVFPNSRTV